ncbi:MAG: hypothetical protein B6I31_04215 [Desulfobacteraceae bacterium 4572_19]|nr:MAG: hypothetical protein B6I31_04215 [Desulfobacteraceae bacterium 4572_19]
MITKVKFENFTTFDQLEVKCSPNINIFIGKNGKRSQAPHLRINGLSYIGQLLYDKLFIRR